MEGESKDDKKQTNLMLVLCGIPGAGKSTVAKELTVVDGLGYHRVISFSFDSFLPGSQWSEESRKAWHEGRDNAYKQARALVEKEIMSTGTLLVVEDNMYLKSMRKPLYHLARESKFGGLEQSQVHCQNSEQGDGDTYKCFFGFPSELQSCAIDNARTPFLSRLVVTRMNENVWYYDEHQVITKMHDRFEWPERALWDSQHSVITTGGTTALEFQLTAIRQAMRDSVPPSPIVDTNAGTKLRGDSSWKHKCDLQIRKEINQAMTYWSDAGNLREKSERQKLAAILRNCRSAVLQEIIQNGLGEELEEGSIEAKAAAMFWSAVSRQKLDLVKPATH